LELINYLEEALKVRIAYAFSDWRQGDQPVYISDIRRITSDLGWHPEVSPCEGINNLASWVEANKELFV
jgi:CDP-paratose 2-epimerase